MRKRSGGSSDHRCPQSLVQVFLDVFDVFEGGALGEEKRSLGFSLELMSRDRTLTDSEIEETVRRSVSEVERRHNAVLRSAS